MKSYNRFLILVFVLLLSGITVIRAKEKAIDPSPTNRDWCVSTDPNLIWTTGDSASSHDVYFGLRFGDVNDANTADTGIYRGNFAVDQNAFAPGSLDEATTYYWRIDEVGSTTVKGDVWSFTTTSPVSIKVDLAQVDCPDASSIRPETAKPGWWHWATNRWSDLYMHDAAWSCEHFPCPDGIADTGITAALTMAREGTGGLKVAGLSGGLAGGFCPTGSPIYDPICNTWFQEVDWPEMEWGTIQLALHNLPAGIYALYSFHNQFGCYRVPGTDDPTFISCDRLRDGDPPMPRIWAMTAKEARMISYQHPDAFSKITGIPWDSPSFPEGVVSIQDARNVEIQQVTSDDDLMPSVIKFGTDGSPVIIHYQAGCCHCDPVRPSRCGGRGILNAFVLQMIPLHAAYAPSPSNGALSVPVLRNMDMVLSWEAGEKAKWHDIYIGTSYEGVRDADTTSSFYRGRQELTDTQYEITESLKNETTYYWKIDEINEPNQWPATDMDVWRFTTEEYVNRR